MVSDSWESWEMKANLTCHYPVITTCSHSGCCSAKATKSCVFFFLIINTLASSEMHVHTHLRGRQKHTMTFNNVNTIGRITVHSTFVKLFGIRDLYWENNSKTVEKIAFCLLGTTTWYFLLFFFISMHSQISHRYIYSLTLLPYWNSLQIKTLLKWWPQGCAKGKTSDVSPAICLS